MDKIDYKIKKYINKIMNNNNNNSYLRKLSEYLLINFNKQKGGRVINFNIDPTYRDINFNLINLQEFIIKTLEGIIKIDKSNENYILIVMGPTGSGKTIARKVGYKMVELLENKELVLHNTKIIEDNMKTKLINTNIEKSFIDISVDDYVYGLRINETSGKDKLRITNTQLIEDMKENINNDKLSENTIEQYSEYRKHINFLPMVMVYIAAYLKINIIFETVCGYWLLDELVKNINYFPLIVYPLVNKDILLQRTIERGKEEFRFINETNINKGILCSNDMFNKIDDKNVNKIFALSYDNNNKELYSEINQNNYSNIDIKNIIYKNINFIKK